MSDQLTQTGFNVDASGNVTALSMVPTYQKKSYALKTAAYTLVPTDQVIIYTTLAAARTVTLPAASAVPAGTEISVRDASGNAGTNNINFSAAGSDTIVGATAIATNNGGARLLSNGVDKWYISLGG